MLGTEKNSIQQIVLFKICNSIGAHNTEFSCSVRPPPPGDTPPYDTNRISWLVVS